MASALARRASRSDYMSDYAASTAARLAYGASRNATQALKRKVSSYGKGGSKRKKVRYASRSGGRSGSSVPKAAQLNTRLAVLERASRKKARKVAFKKTKKVKVTKGFKTKVTKALEPKRINGLFEVSDTQYVRQELDNKQGFFYLGKGSDADVFSGTFSGIVPLGQKNLYDCPWFFDPLRVMQLASWGWNNLGSLSRNVNPLASDMFDMTKGLKIHVKKSWVTFNIKNNSERTWYLKLWVVAPRKGASTRIGLLQRWCESLESEYQSGVRIDQPWIYSIDENPTFTKELQNEYKFVKNEVTIEPGQSFDFNLPGPEDFTYDYEKFYTDAVYLDLQKMMRTVLVTMIPDLQVNFNDTTTTALTAGAVRTGQYGFNRNGSKVGGITIDYREFYDITMPEITGGDADAGDKVVLSRRIDVKGRHDFSAEETVEPHDVRVDAQDAAYHLDK